MKNESLGTISLVVLLLLIILVAVYVQKQQELVVYRPDINEVTGKALELLSGTATSSSTTCPAGCVPAATPVPATDKAKWQLDPVPRITSQVEQKFKNELSKNHLEIASFENDKMWWRENKDGYRILVNEAKTLGVQVPTTETASQLAPKKTGEDHPALRHPLLKKVNKEIEKQMKALNYKKSSMANCPINEAYDPFNNCVSTFTKGEQKCSLIAGYGTLDKKPSATPFLRLELSCSKNYQADYNHIAPYLFSLNIVSPEWLVPDMAIYDIEEVGDWSRVSFGSNYGIFKKIDGGMRLVTGGIHSPSCTLVNSENIPNQIYHTCK